MAKHFMRYDTIDPEQVQFNLGSDKQGKVQVHVNYGETQQDLAMVTCAAVTFWPRVNGDGNFGTMFGPSDASKAKYTLDLNDAQIREKPNTDFCAFHHILDEIDNKLLDFVHENQVRILGRKNLTKPELSMLQIRSVKPRYDKMSGALNGHSINLSIQKFAWDGCGGKYARKITVCDHEGQTITNGMVAPGDVVAATVYANQVYTGVGGDKFGIHWAFQDVSVVCQRSNIEAPAQVNAFAGNEYTFSKPYIEPISEVSTKYDETAQFGEA